MKKRVESKDYLKIMQRKFNKGMGLDDLFKDFEKAEKQLQKELKNGSKILIR